MTRAAQFRTGHGQWQAEPSNEREQRLWALAKEYYLRTEAFDRKVCTGPIGRDGIMPNGPRELGLINRHAAQVLGELIARSGEPTVLRAVMQKYQQSHEHARDMAEAFPDTGAPHATQPSHRRT